MANDKKFVVKNGLQTQNVSFVDSTGNTITVSMLGTDTLSFSGDAGQLFSITDSLSGTIFSVNDISGVPSIEVDDDGTIRFAETFGNVLIGTAVDNGTNKLQVDGSIYTTSNLIVDGDLVINGTTTTVNTATLQVEDNNIVLNYGTGDTTSTANGAGITIQDAVNASTNATILWNTSTNQFDFSHGITATGYNKSNWDTAYGWGNHADAGYLTSVSAEINDLTAAVVWADVPDTNITQSSVTQHQAALSITESQITFTSSFIELGDLSVTTNAASGGGALSYASGTGIFTYTPPDLSGYLTSETSHADVLVDGDFTSAGFMKRGATAGTYSVDTNTYITSAGTNFTNTLGIHKASPTFTINDTDATNATEQTGWISFQRQGSEKAWIGYGSSSNANFTIKNTEGAVTVDSALVVNGLATVSNLTLANPGIGSTSTINFAKTSDTAQIRVTESSADATEFQFYMADNPSSASDKFNWYMNSWQGAGSAWKPLEFSAYDTRINSVDTIFNGNLYIGNQPYISTGGVIGSVIEVKTGTLSLTADVSNFTGSQTHVYIELTTDGTTFTAYNRKSTSGRTAYVTDVAITGTAQTITQGITVTFSGTTGGVAGDNWEFGAWGAGIVDISTQLEVDTIIEHTADAGVTIEGITLKDSSVAIGATSVIDSSGNWISSGGFFRSFPVSGDHDVHVWDQTHAVYSDNTAAPTYIVIDTSVPQDKFSMGGFKLTFQNSYNAETEGGEIDIYGYWNSEGNGGFIGFRYECTNPNLNPTIQVARNTDGNTSFIISGESTNYVQIVARDLWLGYSASDVSKSWGDNWTISGTEDISAYINNNTLTRNGITSTQVSNWNTAYGWGNHASAGYLTAEVNDLSSSVTWTNVPDANITSSSVTQHLGDYSTTTQADAKYANGSKKKWTSLTGASGDWFPLFQITDVNHGGAIVTLKTYAHTSVTFAVGEGYSTSNKSSISILNSTVNDNSAWAGVDALRIRQNGKVEAQLSWASGPNVDIEIQIVGPNANSVTVYSTLTTSVDTDSIVDSVSVTTNGLMRGLVLEGKDSIRLNGTTVIDSSRNLTNIGNITSIDGTASLNNVASLTGGSAVLGATLNATTSSAATYTNLTSISALNQVGISTSVAKTADNVYGIKSEAKLVNGSGAVSGTIDVTNMYGVHSSITATELAGAITVTNGYAAYLTTNIAGSPAFTNLYGLYIDNPTGSLDYAIYSSSGTNYFGGDVVTDRVRDRSGSQLVIAAGESNQAIDGATSNLTGEAVYTVAEGGLVVISSPDNWSSDGGTTFYNQAAWDARNTATICGSNGQSSFPAQITVTGHGNSSQWNTAYGWGDHSAAGYLTGITSSNVTTALGYTPYEENTSLTASDILIDTTTIVDSSRNITNVESVNLAYDKLLYLGDTTDGRASIKYGSFSTASNYFVLSFSNGTSTNPSGAIFQLSGKNLLINNGITNKITLNSDTGAGTFVGDVTGASLKTGSWTIDENASGDLEFVYA